MLKVINSIIIIVAIFSMQFNCFSNESKKVITIGFFIIPPITYEDENLQPKGALIDFYRDYVFKNLPYSVQFVGYPYSRMLKEIEHGDIDMIAATSPEKMNMNIIIGKTILHKTKDTIVTRKDFPYNEITSAKQLENYTIWIKQDSSMCPFIANNISKFKIDSSPGKNSIEYIAKKLLSNRIDAIYTYSIEPVLYVIKNQNAFEQIKVVKIPGNGGNVYAGYSKKLDRKIITKIEQEIQNQLKENRLNIITEKYFNDNKIFKK